MAGTNLGTAYVTIMPSAKGLSKGIASELNSGGTAAGTSAGHNIVGALKGVIAAAGIGTFFKKALDFGGELQQNLGGTQAVFGEYAKEIQTLAEDAYKNMGLSASDYMATANKMGSLFQGSGLEQRRSLELTTKAMQRASDVASVMGISQEMAMESIAGAAKGNFTMMDNLGVAMNATTLAAYALEKGVNFNWNTASNAEKAELAMQMFMERTMQYEGNFARESEDTFTGSIGAMKAAGENLMANLALGNSIKEPLEALIKTTRNYLVGNLFPMVGNILKQIPTLIGSGLKGLFAELPGAVEAIKEWFAALPEKIKSGTGSFISGVKDVFSSIWESLKSTDWVGLATTIFSSLKEAIKTAAPQIGEAFMGIAGNIKEWFMSVDWKEVGRTTLRLIGDGIGTVGSFLWEKIKEIAATAVEWWDGIDWPEAGRNAFHALVNGLKAVGSFLWDALKSIASTAAEHFKNGDTDWKEVGKKALTMIWEGLQAVGSFLWEAIKAIAQTAADWFQEVDWKQVGKDAITLIWNGLQALGHWIWEKLKSLGEKAGEKFKEIDWKQLGKDVIEFIWNGLGAIGHWIWEKLKGIGEDAVEEFKNIDWLQLGKDVINTIWGGISELGHTIWEGLKSIGDTAKSWFDGTDWYGAGANAVNEIANGMYGSSSGVQNAASYLASTMQAAIAGQSWVTTGANVIYGVTSGYTTPAVSRVITRSATNQATKIANSLRRAFDIGSPSKLMRDKVGKWIPLGIVEGMEQEAGAVTDAMRNIATDTANAFDTGFAYNGTVNALEGGVASSDSITVNVYPSAGMNERQLADMVQQRLALAQRQKQAAWGTA